MGFLDELKAQLNVRDGGKTAQTVRRDREAQVAQTKRDQDTMRMLQQKANARLQQQARTGTIPTGNVPGFGVRKPEINQAIAYNQAQSNILGNGQPFKTFSTADVKDQSLIKGAVKNIFDSDSRVDQLNRFNNNRPMSYREDQIAQGNNRPYESLGGQLIGNSLRYATTVGAAIPSVYYNARIQAANLTGNNKALENAVGASERFTNQIAKPDSGAYGVGTFLYDSPEEARTLSTGQALKRSALNTVGVASEIAPYAINPAAGAKLTTRLVANAGVDALTGAGESTARQFANTGRVDAKTLLGDTVASTVMGTIPTVGGAGLKATTKLVKDPVVQVKAQNVAGKTNLTRTVAKQDPLVQQFEKRIDNGVMQASSLKGAEKAAKLDEVRELIRLRNTRTKELSGAGFIAGPLAGDFSKAKANNKVFNDFEGKQQFEVSDRDFKAKDILKHRGSAPIETKLGDVIEHKKLFENYPELANMPVTIKSMHKTQGGGYNRESKSIIINKNWSMAKKEKTILHEAQHAIQHVENFQRGGGYSKVADITAKRINEMPDGTLHSRGMFNVYERKMRDVLKEIREKHGSFVVKDNKIIGINDPVAKPLIEKFNAALKLVEEEWAKPRRDGIQHKAYEDIMGENVARTTTNRRMMTDAERAKNPFYKNMDADPKNAIMVNDKGEYLPIDKKAYNSIMGTDKGEPNGIPKQGRTDSTPSPTTEVRRRKEVEKTSETTSPKPTIQDALEGRSTKLAVIAPSKPKTTVRVSETTGIPDKLTKTQALPPTPPKKPPVGFDEPPLLGTGKQKATKYASKTIPESKYVSKDIQDATKKNAPLYTPENEKLRYNQALTKYEKVGRDKFENDLYEQLGAKKGNISSSTVAEAQALAAKLDAEGNFAKASEIYDKISEHLTAAGQTIQAAAIMSRRTPEGLKRHARMSLTKSGITITPVMDKELTKLTQAVRLAKTDLAKQKAVYAVGEFVKKSTPDNIWNKSINIWRAGLLTSPMTTAGNLFANASETAIRKGIINPVSTIADMAMGAFTGKRTMTMASAGSGAKGFVKGAKTLPDYMKTGFQPGDANLKAKYDNSGTINYGNGVLGKTIGGYVNGIYRLMGVADAPFRMTAESEVLSSIAKAEAINKGLKGEARKQFMQEFIANPPKSVAQRVADEGTRATFQNDTLLNDVASGIKQRLERKSAPAKAVSDFVMPFVRTPSAIATRMIERTPIGVAKEITNQILAVRAGKGFDQRAMSQAIGNGTFGTLAIGAGLALANSGQMTYGFPSDESERKLWELEGRQPYSVKIGDRWYSLNYLQPFGTLLAIGGQAGEDINAGSSKSEAITKALGTAGQSIQEQSFLKGINGVLSTISDPERSARKYMEQTFSSVTPNAVRSFARASDDVQREPTTITDSVKSGIPGLRDNTPVKKDVFGRDLSAKDTFLNQFVNPLRPSKAKSDPLTVELRKLKDAGLATFPTESNKNVFGKDKPLDKDSLNSLNSTVAKSVAEQWQSITSSQEYKNLSDEDKKKTLDSIKRDYGAVAKAQWAYDNGYGADYKPDLTAKQESILSGDKPSYFEKPKTSTKTTKAKTVKTTKKTSKKSSGRKSSASRKKLDSRMFQYGNPATSLNSKLQSILEQAKVG